MQKCEEVDHLYSRTCSDVNKEWHHILSTIPVPARFGGFLNSHAFCVFDTKGWIMGIMVHENIYRFIRCAILYSWCLSHFPHVIKVIQHWQFKGGEAYFCSQFQKFQSIFIGLLIQEQHDARVWTSEEAEREGRSQSRKYLLPVLIPRDPPPARPPNRDQLRTHQSLFINQLSAPQSNHLSIHEMLGPCHT